MTVTILLIWEVYWSGIEIMRKNLRGKHITLKEYWSLSVQKPRRGNHMNISLISAKCFVYDVRKRVLERPRNMGCLHPGEIFSCTSSFRTQKVRCHLLIIKHSWAYFVLASTTDEDGCAFGHPAVHWRGSSTNTHPSPLMVQLQGQEPSPGLQEGRQQ